MLKDRSTRIFFDVQEWLGHGNGAILFGVVAAGANGYRKITTLGAGSGVSSGWIIAINPGPDRSCRSPNRTATTQRERHLNRAIRAHFQEETSDAFEGR